MTFSVPIRDIRYALDHMADFGSINDAYADLSEDLVSAILEEMGKFCDQVISPLNVVSDANGATLQNGVVRTTPGFKEAYEQYVAGGWNSLSFPEDVGGQGLPSTLGVVLMESVNAGSMAFGLCPMLTTGAIKAIQHAGDDHQKKLYLQKMISGEWTGAMNLTEPQAGSDLSGIRTKAEPIGDGRYKISGQKIYITYGDHDMTDNVVHLVLARLPDAPEGTGGISMFLVPKVHVNDDGTLGAKNDVSCVGLEEKLGIHGSPTCVMAFGEAGECYGTLLGEENRGLKNMFVMMNSARLDVGMQGVGVAEAAYQHALAYALDRKQGRPIGVKTGDQVSLYEHPDIRRMLFTMKSQIEAARGICYANAVAYDMARVGENDEERQKARALEGLLTPISKAWGSDRAVEITSLGVQVHGGMGFIEETGAAQFMRDARITPIYEGTNGIQAMDLVGRKLQGDGGAAAEHFISTVKENIAALKAAGGDAAKIGDRLEAATDALAESTKWILATAKTDQESVLAGATPYLKQFGNVAGGHFLAKGALSVALSGDKEFAAAKLQLALFFAENFLTEAVGLTAAVTAGAAPLSWIDPAHLNA